MREFRKHLGADGVLTLYMINSNAGAAVAAHVASQYFYDFIEKKNEEFRFQRLVFSKRLHWINHSNFTYQM